MNSFARRSVAAAISIFFFITAAFSQHAKPVVDAEHAFAARALQAGSKTAFLEFASNDAVLFLPERIRAADYWNNQRESPTALIWAPNFADISSNGSMGYTTGNWELRPNGKDSAPVAFGQFVTIWQRQADGRYKYSLDIGISHEKPESFTSEWHSVTSTHAVSQSTAAVHTANRFYELANLRGFAKAYEQFLAEDVRVFREGAMPAMGEKKFKEVALKGVEKIEFRKRSVFVEAGDLAYVTNTYALTRRDGTVENGNFLQIWKVVGKKWKIVLDIFKPIPAAPKS